jgi:hypothetical protein
MIKAHQKYKVSGYYNRDCSDSCRKDFDTTVFWIDTNVLEDNDAIFSVIKE